MHDTPMKKHGIATYTNLFYAAAALAPIYHGIEAGLFIFCTLAVAYMSFRFHLTGGVHRTPEHRGDEGAVYGEYVVLGYYAWFFEPWVLVGLTAGLCTLLLRLDKANTHKIVPYASVFVLAGIFISQGIEAGLIVGAAAALTGAAKVFLEDKDFNHGLWHFLGAATVYLALLFTKEVINLDWNLL